MKNLQLINGKYYIIHRAVPIHMFKSKDGNVQPEWMKIWKDMMLLVDHVMKTETHVLFAETVQDAVVIEETVNQELYH